MIARAVLVTVFAVLLALAACGSDEFGLVGGGMPIDVSQDSLAVQAAPIDASTSASVVPALTQAFIDRELLFSGTRSSGGWRATPLFRFNFSRMFFSSGEDIINEERPVDFDLLFDGNWTSVRLALERTLDSPSIDRSAILFALADTLSADMADVALQSSLGPQLYSFDEATNGTGLLEFDLDRTQVEAWIRDGAHTGVALFDTTPTASFDEGNFAELASDELRQFTLIDLAGADETVAGEIVIELADGSFVAFDMLEDLTHFARDETAGTVTLGSHLASRVWLQFEFGSIPSNATVNFAQLRLRTNRQLRFGDGTFSARAYRTPLADADAGTLSNLELILDSSSSFDFTDGTELVIEVTDFVQRGVNGVLGADDGIMVKLIGESLNLNVVDFFDQTAAVDSLRPRLEITFTPPADFRD